MSPQNDVNRLKTLPTLAKPEQLIFALDSSFAAPNPGTCANQAQGVLPRAARVKKHKGAAFGHALETHSLATALRR
jgi:hypothetical protein